jgi:hypothetical protein
VVTGTMLEPRRRRRIPTLIYLDFCSVVAQVALNGGWMGCWVCWWLDGWVGWWLAGWLAGCMDAGGWLGRQLGGLAFLGRGCLI